MRLYSCLAIALVLSLSLTACRTEDQQQDYEKDVDITYQQALVETYNQAITFCGGESQIAFTSMSDWSGKRTTVCKDQRHREQSYKEVYKY